jgi:hypothetical protein
MWTSSSDGEAPGLTQTRSLCGRRFGLTSAPDRRQDSHSSGGHVNEQRQVFWRRSTLNLREENEKPACWTEGSILNVAHSDPLLAFDHDA